jgi:hypothetical protein
MSRIRLSQRDWTLTIVGAAITLAVGYTSYQAWWAVRASHTLVMGRFATGLVEDFVRQHNGRWPSSWEELEVLADQKSDRHSPVSDAMRHAVSIDFHAKPAILARQSPTEFTAIRPRAPCSAEYHEYWRIESLIRTIREFRDEGRDSRKD